MAKRHRVRHRGRRFRGYLRRHKPKPALIDLIGVGVPQLVTLSGAQGIGWDAINPLMAGDLKGAWNAFAADEVLMWSGYNAQTGAWNPLHPTTIMNYGMTFALPWIIKKIFKHKSIKIPFLGNMRLT